MCSGDPQGRQERNLVIKYIDLHMKMLVIKGSKWLFFFFCSKSAEFLHVAFISAEKHCPVIVFAGLLFVFEK